ncbi:MAG: hypothetical protein JWN44_1096 [Myxococcales bacterium]|nr:hypothetical protein [Myxococcales bacterium]
MRTPYLFAALMIAAVGCDDVHSGQQGDPSGPVRLVRIMVQDSQPFGIRAVAMDLLNTPGSPLSTAVACSDIQPCLPQFVLAGSNPDFSCTAAGVCNDPLAAGVAPLVPAVTGAPGEEAGIQIRLVFSKLLDMTDAKAAGAFEVLDATGAKVAGMASWDPSGSPINSSDPIRSPFGPALVFKPAAPLAPHQSYTVRIDSSKVVDRAGSALADQNGAVVSGFLTKPFTTEDVQMLAATTLTNVTAPGVQLTPDQILQIGFNSGVDPATVACTATSAGTAVGVRAYSEAGTDAAKCATALDDTLVNLVATDALGAPADWPAGDYGISCSGKDSAGGASTFSFSGTFQVAGAPAAGDPNSRAQHVICP